MFSFIRKFFENHRKKVVERNQLCDAMFNRVTNVLIDYIDVDHCCKESVQKWLSDNECLRNELYGISKFKRASNFSLLQRQKNIFEKDWEEANISIRSLIAREQQKRENAEYVSKKINLWISEQKKHKNKDTVPQKLSIEQFDKLSKANSFAKERCSCCGKDGRIKRLYSTEIDALSVVEQRSKIIGHPLRVYSCPDGFGYHITSNMN